VTLWSEKIWNDSSCGVRHVYRRHKTAEASQKNLSPIHYCSLKVADIAFESQTDKVFQWVGPVPLTSVHVAYVRQPVN
jgi:hypothetical protein